MTFIDRKDLPADFTITYHAGFMDTPENTTESIKAALEMNAQVAEIDVTFRRNGLPVMAHLDIAEDDQGEPLENALKAVAESKGTKLNLDIKSVLNIPAVDALIKKYGLEGRSFYTGIEKDWTVAMKEGSTLPYYLNHNLSAEETADENTIESVAQEIIKLGACGLNTHHANVNEAVIRIMHSHSLPVSVWTCSDEESMKRMLTLRPDNITSNRPDMLKPLINW